MAMAMAAVLLLFVLVAPTVHSLQYDVTWTLGTNYNSWAAGKTFTVGDILVFTYTLDHAVDVVDGSDYASCNTGNPLNSYTGGLTTITLTTPGSIYFICPTEGHCQAGMKLKITVAAAAASPTTPTSPPPSSTTTPTSPPPASTTTPTSPPPASTTAPTSPPPASATTPTSTPSPSPSVSPSPTVTSPSRSPSSSPSPTTSTSPVVTTAPSSPKSSSGAGSMFGDMNHLVIIGFSVVVAGLVGFLV